MKARIFRDTDARWELEQLPFSTALKDHFPGRRRASALWCERVYPMAYKWKTPQSQWIRAEIERGDDGQIVRLSVEQWTDHAPKRLYGKGRFLVLRSPGAPAEHKKRAARARWTP